MNNEHDSLHRSIEAAKSLRLDLAREFWGSGEVDQQALQDTFDGETTLDIEIRRAVLAIEEDEIFIRGIKAREAELKERRQRLEKRVEATRGLIEQAMTIANWPKHEMDIGTVSIGKSAPRIEIDDESQIPSQFWKRQDPVLDKAGLGKVLKEREKALAEREEGDSLQEILREFPKIPGCHLETGVTLTIRRS